MEKVTGWSQIQAHGRSLYRCTALFTNQGNCFRIGWSITTSSTLLRITRSIGDITKYQVLTPQLVRLEATAVSSLNGSTWTLLTVILKRPNAYQSPSSGMYVRPRRMIQLWIPTLWIHSYPSFYADTYRSSPSPLP